MWLVEPCHVAMLNIILSLSRAAQLPLWACSLQGKKAAPPAGTSCCCCLGAVMHTT